MLNSYSLYVGIDVSKGKADAAILRISRDRNISPKFIRKKLSFKFVKSDVNKFIDTVRSYVDHDCTSVTYAMEVTGIYSDNIYDYIHSNTNDNESVCYLNTEFVNKYRESHNLPKSDPLDAQTIAKACIDDEAKFVYKHDFEKEKGYADLKAYVHRYYQLKTTYSQEINRLIAKSDLYFPELQYVFETNSATFVALLSSYPTTHDIIEADKYEVFSIAYEASKHKATMKKIDDLFALCNDSLVPDQQSEYTRKLIISQAEKVKDLKDEIRNLSKEIKSLAQAFITYSLLLSIPGCGPITAATIVAETGDIRLFSNADKYVSYSGCSPRNKRSGSSVDTAGKISKKGSRFLRHAIYLIAEFGRRHNPILKKTFERVKNGNKKRHKLAVIAVANKIARYVYSVMKNKSRFVIKHEDIMQLPKETRDTFFSSITMDVSSKDRKQIYMYSDEYGVVHQFSYVSKNAEESIA